MRKFWRSEKGSIFPMMYMIIVMMLVMMMFLVDIGRIRIAQTELYTAIDAATLAGVLQADTKQQWEHQSRCVEWECDEFGCWCVEEEYYDVFKGETVEIRQQEAEAKAREMFQRNLANSSVVEETETVYYYPSQDKMGGTTVGKVSYLFFPPIANMFNREISSETQVPRMAEAQAKLEEPLQPGYEVVHPYDHRPEDVLQYPHPPTDEWASEHLD